MNGLGPDKELIKTGGTNDERVHVRRNKMWSLQVNRNWIEGDRDKLSDKETGIEPKFR